MTPRPIPGAGDSVTGYPSIDGTLGRMINGNLQRQNEPPLRCAGLGTRALSWLIDGAIFLGVGLVGLIVLTVYMLNWASPETRGGLGTWLFWEFAVAMMANLLLALYCLVFWSRGGQTLGKRATRLRVVRSDGQPLSLWRALQRLTAMNALSQALLIGYVWPAFNRERRTLHDIAAGTWVIEA